MMIINFQLVFIYIPYDDSKIRSNMNTPGYINHFL